MNLRKLLTLGMASVIIPCSVCVASDNSDIFKYKNVLQNNFSNSKLANFNIHDYVGDWLFNKVIPNYMNTSVEDVRKFVTNTSPDDLKQILTSADKYGNIDETINGNAVLNIIQNMKPQDIKNTILKLMPTEANTCVNMNGLKDIINSTDDATLKNNISNVIADNFCQSLINYLDPNRVKNVLLQILSLEGNDYNPQNMLNIIWNAVSEQNNNKIPIQTNNNNNNPSNNKLPVKNNKPNIPANNPLQKNEQSNNTSISIDEIISDKVISPANQRIKNLVASYNKDSNNKMKIDTENYRKLSMLWPGQNQITNEEINANKDLKNACNLLAYIKKCNVLFKNKNLIDFINKQNDQFKNTKLLGDIFTLGNLPQFIQLTPVEAIENIFVEYYIKYYKSFAANTKKQVSLFAHVLGSIFNYKTVNLDNKDSYKAIEPIYNNLLENLNKIYNNNGMFGVASGNNKIISHYSLLSKQIQDKISEKVPDNIVNSNEYTNTLKVLNGFEIPLPLSCKQIQVLSSHKLTQDLKVLENNKKELFNQKDIYNIKSMDDLIVLLSNILHKYNNNQLITNSNKEQVKKLLESMQINKTLIGNEQCINAILCHSIMDNTELVNDIITDKLNSKLFDVNNTNKINSIGELFMLLSEICEKAQQTPKEDNDVPATDAPQEAPQETHAENNNNEKPVKDEVQDKEKENTGTSNPEDTPDAKQYDQQPVVNDTNPQETVNEENKTPIATDTQNPVTAHFKQTSDESENTQQDRKLDWPPQKPTTLFDFVKQFKQQYENLHKLSELPEFDWSKTKEFLNPIKLNITDPTQFSFRA